MEWLRGSCLAETAEREVGLHVCLSGAVAEDAMRLTVMGVCMASTVVEQWGLMIMGFEVVVEREQC